MQYKHYYKIYSIVSKLYRDRQKESDGLTLVVLVSINQDISNLVANAQGVYNCEQLAYPVQSRLRCPKLLVRIVKI